MKDLNETINKEMGKAEATYLRTLGDKIKSIPKDLWKYVKSKRNNKVAFPGTIDDVNYGDDVTNKTEHFNHYFQSIFPGTAAIVEDLPISIDFEQTENIEITEQGVAPLLKNVKVNPASGPDPNYVLKNCAASVAPFLVIPFQTSIEEGSLPKDWKSGNIVPVFKGGDRTNTRNYRPISPISVSCKLLEHIIYTNLMSHLQSSGFFYGTQHGFRRGFSCDTQLIESPMISHHQYITDTRLTAYFWIFGKLLML